MIGSTYLSDKELKKEIKRYTDKLRKRVKRIRNLGDEAMQDAVYKFDEYMQNRQKITPKTTRKELESYYRKLKYVESLKSSTVKGARESAKTAMPVLKALKSLSQEKQKTFWNIYERMLNQSSIFENFKYEIWGTGIDLLFQGEDITEIVQSMIEEYDNLVKELGSMADDETIKILYTERLQQLRK